MMNISVCKILTKDVVNKLISIHGKDFYDLDEIPELLKLGHKSSSLESVTVDILSSSSVGVNTLSKHYDKISLTCEHYDNIPMLLQMKMNIHSIEFDELDLSKVFISGISYVDDCLTKIDFSRYDGSNNIIYSFTYSDYELNKARFHHNIPALLFTNEVSYSIDTDRYPVLLESRDKLIGVPGFTYGPLYCSDPKELTLLYKDSDKLLDSLGIVMSDDEMIEIDIFG